MPSTTSPSSRSKGRTIEVGPKGVQLKHYEQVVKNLLLQEEICVNYSQLPLLSVGGGYSEEWPFDVLPPIARVWGSEKGQLKDQVRAKRKEDQLKCMIRCIVALLRHIRGIHNPQDEEVGNLDLAMLPCATLVDFGGGSGHLAIPLALLLPQCRVIVVDLGGRSLELLHEKARRIVVVARSVLSCRNSVVVSDATKWSDSNFQKCPTIPNLFSFHGPVHAFEVPFFDLGIALHLCGEATDVALRKCQSAQARALVFCPCCVGKLQKNNRKNPYIFQATGDNVPTVQYPQSEIFQQCFRGFGRDNDNNEYNDDWNALAKAADYGEMLEYHTGRGSARRTAKSLLETDRRYFLESHGYETALTRMEPWTCTPKNDILLAWRRPNSSTKSFHLDPNPTCLEDLQQTQNYLFGTNASTINAVVNSVDWTAAEEIAMKQDMESFFRNHHNSVLVFPTGMGARKRKLIHSVAQQLGLAHWSVGTKKDEKTVAVAAAAAAAAQLFGTECLENKAKECM